MQNLCKGHRLTSVASADPKCDSHSPISTLFFCYQSFFNVFLTSSNFTKIHWHRLWANMSHIHQIPPKTLFDSDTLCMDYRRKMQTWQFYSLCDWAGKGGRDGGREVRGKMEKRPENPSNIFKSGNNRFLVLMLIFNDWFEKKRTTDHLYLSYQIISFCIHHHQKWQSRAW